MSKTDPDPQEKAQPVAQHPQASLQSLEAKIDQILAYQKNLHRWAIVRGVVDIMLFLIFIVLPIIGGIYLYRYLATQVDFGKLASQYNQVVKAANQLNSLSPGSFDIQSILNKINGK